MSKLFIAIVLGLGFLYVGDILWVRFRGSEAFGTVEVQTYYAIPQKNGRTDFEFGDPENQTCVKSFFPHSGDNPCWYVRRHKDERTDL
jgi:hypothetical protein